MEYVFIDPLKLAIRRTITRTTYPLSARVLFGSEKDIEEIAPLTENLLKSGKTPLLWMSHILEPRRARQLSRISDSGNFACIVGENSLTDPIKESWRSLEKVPLFFYDSTGALHAENLQANEVEWNDLVTQNIHTLRASWIECMLRPLLEQSRKRTSSEEPIKLPSGRLVSEWINMKSVLQDPDDAFSIAYELGFVLSNGYQDELQEITTFACSNNTGLILASHLSLIFGKEFLVIDRAGPLPRLPAKAFPDIAGQNICLVEDTIATGREVDLASLFIRMKGATLTEILAVCKIGPARPTVAQLVPMKVLFHLPDTTVVEKQPSSEASMKGASNHGG